jgi:hypothetical protein
VTKETFQQLLQETEFIFYWGHGPKKAIDGPLIYGSTGNHEINVREVVPGSPCRGLYLDACGLCKILEGYRFADTLLVCPEGELNFGISITVGCSIASDT